MRWICIAAGTAAAIGAPAAQAADTVYTLEISGTVDHVFNQFDPPLDGTAAGDAWTLKISYDTNIPSQGSNPFLQSFKNSLCAIELVFDGKTYTDDDFAGGTCDIIITDDPCVCGHTSGIMLDFTLPDGAVGFNLAITDDGGNFLPLMDLPTDQTDIGMLADFTQFEFFSPTTLGSTARALTVGVDDIFIVKGKIPAPGTAALLALTGLTAARRRRR
ncbi:MAG: hypothetical protein DHS20C14_03470 [Phycisphaeraceae bacterium]|nr:MAG: hypothetical protein DHS20C14_03470 [Phycisphaeraceae bacterium]